MQSHTSSIAAERARVRARLLPAGRIHMRAGYPHVSAAEIDRLAAAWAQLEAYEAVAYPHRYGMVRGVFDRLPRQQMRRAA